MIDLPTCVVCNKPVDEMIESVRIDIDCRRYEVHCHGEIQVLELPNRFFQANKIIGCATAFSTKMLTDA